MRNKEAWLLIVFSVNCLFYVFCVFSLSCLARGHAKARFGGVDETILGLVFVVVLSVFKCLE